MRFTPSFNISPGNRRSGCESRRRPRVSSEGDDGAVSGAVATGKRSTKRTRDADQSGDCRFDVRRQMRAVLQRVTKGKVTVETRVTGEIGYGLVILLGVAMGDAETEVDLMANKVANLRIFADSEGKFNLSALDVKA